MQYFLFVHLKCICVQAHDKNLYDYFQSESNIKKCD